MGKNTFFHTIQFQLTHRMHGGNIKQLLGKLHNNCGRQKLLMDSKASKQKYDEKY